MTDSLVPVNKGMVADERVTEGRGLLFKAGVQILAAPSHHGLSSGGLQSPVITNARTAASLRQDHLVDGDEFSNGQIAHHASRR